MSIKLQLKGLEEMLEKLQAAGKDVDSAAKKCITESAKIVEKEYVAQMRASNVDQGLIDRMDPIRYETGNNTYAAKIGYKTGNYNPKDLTDGFKAIFINYGTPRISPREFIAHMKKKAYPQVKKKQKEIFDEIMGDLQ